MLKYDPYDKSTDIHQFIAKIDTLANRANIAQSERKQVLYEHIPASLNPQLLGSSKDNGISYEKFAGDVADSAFAQQRAIEECYDARR